jgi:hypothetical protein
VLHAPQLLLSVDVLVHTLAQAVCVDGQLQTPAWHVMLPAQLNWVPQPPQLGAFVCVLVVSLTQVAPQRVVPAGQVWVHA